MPKPITVTADQMCQAFADQFPQEFEVTRLRVLVAEQAKRLEEYELAEANAAAPEQSKEQA
jgi:hypothetical protein